jgi:asparagine synthase (glutamine-hydrolysing)
VFEAWGIRKTLDLIVGMFAISLWDRSERRLHLMRDRFGEKPLYYGWVGSGFVFGSELKALRRHPSFRNSIDRNVLALYLQFCYVPAPYSIYRDLYKLEPGCILSLSYEDTESPPSKALFSPVQRGTLSIEHFWSLAEIVRNGSSSPVTDDRDAVDQLEKTLLESVLLQSKADVPLGAFLTAEVQILKVFFQVGQPHPYHQ